MRNPISTHRWTSMLLCGLMIVFFGLQPTWARVPHAPTNLRCMDKQHPVGTDNNPYFGWYVNDPDDGETQTAYQILVASDVRSLAANQGRLWDSGRILSNQQNYVYYQGPPLTSATRYYWKVRTWDKDGQVSPYSAPAIFDTGLFTHEDWSGTKWIKRDTKDADDYTYYRRSFSLNDKVIQRAMVYVTAMHKYELYLNGSLVGKGPAFHYPQYHYYNAYDITSLLSTQKENTLACLTHWYGGGQGRPKGERGFLLKAIIEYADGTRLIVGTDRTWRQSQAMSWITGQPRRNGEGVGYVDKIDARQMIPNWYTLDFDDRGWSESVEIGAPPVAPWTNPLQMDLTRVNEKEVLPVSINHFGEGTYVIDFGKVYSGVPQIVFSGGNAGTVINMRGGYTLNDDGTVSTESTQKTNMSYSFVLDGKTAVFQPMVYLGMRYFQVDNAPHALTKENVTFIFRYYELDASRSQFKSSNDMLNRVWDLMKHTLLVGAQEAFVDTPTREKGGFLGDSWSQSVPAMSTMGDRTMTLRVLEEFLDSQEQYWPDGRLNAVYPNRDGKRDIPDYTQSYLVWVWDYYLHTGNLTFLRTHYDKLKKVADYVDAYRNKDTGLIHNLAGGSGPYEYGIIDWPPTMRYGYDVDTESRTVINAYAYVDFDMIAKIAEVLGKSKDRDIYQAKAQAIKKAMNSQLINDQGVYIDGLYADRRQSLHVSQHANMFPLAMDLVPQEHLATVINAVKERQMSVGMVTVRWLPEALGRSNQGAHLLDLYTRKDWDGWARTVSQGGTTTWETWHAPLLDASMSHPWGAVGLLGIQQYILGVHINKAQHEEILVRPLAFPAKLTHVAGTLPTDRGDISVGWKRNSSRFSMTITIPDNMTALVYLPKYSNQDTQVTVDGMEQAGTEEGEYIAVGKIGSGTHRFERTITQVR